MLNRLLGRVKARSLSPMLDGRLCLPDLEASGAEDAIRVLSAAAAERAGLSPEWVAEKVLEREAMMSTAIGHGMAVPHARLILLTGPLKMDVESWNSWDLRSL